MSKASRPTIEGMARTALGAITSGRDFSRWQVAVICAIQLDAEHNAGRNVSILAELGQYLGDDCDGYLSTEAERLQRTLNNLKG